MAEIVRFKVNDQQLRRLLGNLQNVDEERIIWRALTRAKRQIAAAFRRAIVAEIQQRGLVDTRAMQKGIKVQAVQDRQRLEIRFLPSFPRTAYVTPAGRGRVGASKRGQYAFIVNSRAKFIQGAQARLTKSGEVGQILNKHLAFIVDQTLKGQ